MTIRSAAKFALKNDRSLTEKWQISPEYSEVSKFWLWWDPYVQNRKFMSLKFTEELCVLTMKNDAKFEDELTYLFKIDMRNLTKCNPSTRKSKKFSL